MCSSPPPAAMADFWNMIWQYQVPVVLMLTNFVENERVGKPYIQETNTNPIAAQG